MTANEQGRDNDQTCDREVVLGRDQGEDQGRPGLYLDGTKERIKVDLVCTWPVPSRGSMTTRFVLGRTKETHLPHYIEVLDKIFCRLKPIFDRQKLYRKQNATVRRLLFIASDLGWCQNSVSRLLLVIYC